MVEGPEEDLLTRYSSGMAMAGILCMLVLRQWILI